MNYGRENTKFLDHLGVVGDVFGSPRVAVELSPEQAKRPEAVAGFMLAGNLLARLFRSVYLVAPDVAVGPNPWQLRSLRELTAPLGEISEGTVEWGRPARVDLALGVGEHPTIPTKRQTFVAFSGWHFGLELEVPEAKSDCILGGLAAACFGASQLFLHAADLSGTRYRPMSPFQCSLLTYGQDHVAFPPLGDIDLGESHLVGVGAIGCGLIYALGHFPRLKGVLHAIDNDGVDDSNLQRYSLMRRVDVGARKVDVAVAALSETGLLVTPHDEPFGRYYERERPRIDLLLTPVDSEAGRRKLAQYLPRKIINAATGGATVTLSTHGFGEGQACLACLYPLVLDDKSWELTMAGHLGVPVKEVLALMEENEGVDAEFIQRVEAHRGLKPGTLSDWVEKPVQSLYQRAVCTEAAIATPGGTVVAPLSFISAIAGVLLAAELVKERATGLAAFRLRNYFRFDLLHAPNPDMRDVKLVRSGCICGDSDYLDVYRRRWAVPNF